MAAMRLSWHAASQLLYCASIVAVGRLANCVIRLSTVQTLSDRQLQLTSVVFPFSFWRVRCKSRAKENQPQKIHGQDEGPKVPRVQDSTTNLEKEMTP